MSKRTTFTNVTPLPAGVSREAALGFLHDHEAMIDLNPLVIERHRLPEPPAYAPDDERASPEAGGAGCTWWSMTDMITYLPGIKGELTYAAAFLDLRHGLQTHVYAPMGTDIRNRWTLGGTLPGEPVEPVELGLGAPHQGLYIREVCSSPLLFPLLASLKLHVESSFSCSVAPFHPELFRRLLGGKLCPDRRADVILPFAVGTHQDVELRCNFLMAGFVRKTLSKAHTKVIENIAERAKAQTEGARGPDGSAANGGGVNVLNDGVYGQGGDYDSQQAAATATAVARRQRRLDNAAAHLPPVYGHRAAASETNLSPISPTTPDTLCPSLASGQYFHTHQDSWSSANGGWPLHPRGEGDRSQEGSQ
ncbi:uncharacterized protein PG998_004079 [Apiospora kogelbergensis]|uniref:uncharacterized protein n=1 Tax=Apiospora kogelbergensis TaxID=1337665 RepID=UPI00312E80F8